MAQAVIMAGGPGERFWPMTQDSIHVVTTEPHSKLIREELPQMKRRNLLIEPVRNNTAAAIFLSCEVIRDRFSDEETVSFFPADHLIQNESEFSKTMRSTIRLAETKEFLVTVGIQPIFPATGYGYIQSGVGIDGFAGAYRVKRFVEKPDHQKAVGYLRRRDFSWNAGIFTWRTGVFTKAINRFSPEFAKNFNLKNLLASYKRLPTLSIDYALMEKADNIAVVRTRMDWCDMGNWDRYFQKSPADKAGNFTYGNTHHRESSHALFINQTKQPLIALGVRDLIVVNTPLGLLICKKGRTEEAALLFKKMNSPRPCKANFKSTSQGRGA